MLLNNWNETPVIKKASILNFEFLQEGGYIKEIEDEYYCIAEDLKKIELEVYKKEASSLAKEVGIKSVDKEIKDFIKKLSTYNELKDTAQCLLGKIADRRKTTIKDVHDEFEVPEK